MGRLTASLLWGVADAALESESGDTYVVTHAPGGVIVAVIDGLGHGPEAAAAAKRAAEMIGECGDESVELLLARCHERLRGTRGAVMSIARFDEESPPNMTWVGVGNVEGVVHRAADGRRDVLGTRGGVVGYQIPHVRMTKLPINTGDTLIFITDGIDADFAAPLPTVRDPQELADEILATHAKGTDDALVLVARYQGVA